MSAGGILGDWRRRARQMKQDTFALYLACRDPRVPWYAKAVAGIVVAYAFSPIDLIPDWIPILGFLDDLLLVPLGIVLALRLIPQPVMADCRARAAGAMASGSHKPRNVLAGAVIVAIWLAVAGGSIVLVVRALPG